jgi:hypothetical protein
MKAKEKLLFCFLFIKTRSGLSILLCLNNVHIHPNIVIIIGSNNLFLKLLRILPPLSSGLRLLRIALLSSAELRKSQVPAQDFASKSSLNALQIVQNEIGCRSRGARGRAIPTTILSSKPISQAAAHDFLAAYLDRAATDPALQPNAGISEHGPTSRTTAAAPNLILHNLKSCAAAWEIGFEERMVVGGSGEGP